MHAKQVLYLRTTSPALFHESKISFCRSSICCSTEPGETCLLLAPLGLLRSGRQQNLLNTWCAAQLCCLLFCEDGQRRQRASSSLMPQHLSGDLNINIYPSTARTLENQWGKCTEAHQAQWVKIYGRHKQHRWILVASLWEGSMKGSTRLSKAQECELKWKNLLQSKMP